MRGGGALAERESLRSGARSSAGVGGGRLGRARESTLEREVFSAWGWGPTRIGK